MPKQLKLFMGLEHERIIRDKTTGEIAHVNGTNQMTFPHDTLACLAETRGLYASNAAEAVNNFLQMQSVVDAKYSEAGLTLQHGESELSEELFNEALEREGLKEDELVMKNRFRGGGLHIHFSLMPEDGVYAPSHLLQNPAFVELVCVPSLDREVGRWIEGKSGYRRPGKWEVKDWGFEYRSLLWKGDPVELLQIAIRARAAVVTALCQMSSFTASIMQPCNFHIPNKPYFDVLKTHLAGATIANCP